MSFDRSFEAVWTECAQNNSNNPINEFQRFSVVGGFLKAGDVCV